MSFSLRARVHGALWNEADPEHRRLWKESLANFDLLQPSAGELRQIEFLLPPGEWFQVRLLDKDGRVLKRWPLLEADWASRLQEYGRTIEQLTLADREAPFRGWHALDYAKRIVHDESAWALREVLVPELSFDIDQARALFTILFVVAAKVPASLLSRHRAHSRPLD